METGILPGMADAAQGRKRARVWIDNGYRLVRILSETRDKQKVYVEWCHAGKWRKWSTAIPKDQLLDVKFSDMPVASQMANAVIVADEKPKRSRRIRSSRS